MTCPHPKDSRLAFYPGTTGGTERCLDCGAERQQVSQRSAWWWDWKQPGVPGAVACIKLPCPPGVELLGPGEFLY